jgi:hypothetical protein
MIGAEFNPKKAIKGGLILFCCGRIFHLVGRKILEKVGNVSNFLRGFFRILDLRIWPCAGAHCIAYRVTVVAYPAFITHFNIKNFVFFCRESSAYTIWIKVFLVLHTLSSIMPRRSIPVSVSLSQRHLLSTANEGPVRIQYKCLVPIYVFPETKLCSLFISKTEFLLFCLPIPTLIHL